MSRDMCLVKTKCYSHPTHVRQDLRVTNPIRITASYQTSTV
jgi:hypothetical protein